MKRNKCPACGKAGSRTIEAINWEYVGKGEETYTYLVCDSCGTLFREETDIDYSQIYNGEYGSYEPISQLENKYIKRKIRKIRNSYVYLNKHKIVGKMINSILPAGKVSLPDKYLKQLAEEKTLLDVGCRYGHMVYKLYEAGANVHGIEPFLDKDIHYKNGLTIKKSYIKDVQEKYDIIFYDNVFEHLETPVEDLRAAGDKLKNRGVIVMVFPGYGDLTKIFKENSYIIQPPQHVALYTEQGVENVARQAGLQINYIEKLPVLEWYLKSYWLKNKIGLSGKSYAHEELENMIPYDQMKKIEEMISNSIEGDFYTVELIRQSEN